MNIYLQVKVQFPQEGFIDSAVKKRYTDIAINKKGAEKMKKFLALFLTVLILTGAFTSCGKSEGDDTRSTDDTTLENTTQETTEPENSSRAAEYLMKDPFDLFEQIKPTCNRMTCLDFDKDWTVAEKTDKALVLINPGYPRLDYITTISHDACNIQLNEKLAVIGNAEGMVIITGDTSYVLQIFELVDAVLSDCPEELRYTGDYLRDNYEKDAVNGTARYEKEGIEYSVTYVPKTTLWSLVLKVK